MQMFVPIMLLVSIIILFKYGKQYMKHKNIYIGVAIGIISGILNTFLYKIVYLEINILLDSLFNIILYSLVAIAGQVLTKTVKYPLWWPNENDKKQRCIYLSIIIAVIFGLLLVALQVITPPMEKSNVMLEQFRNYMYPSLLVLIISFQAAVTEETVFRLFLIPLISKILNHLKVDEKYIKTISIIMVSILFGFIHPNDFLVAFISSLILGSVYLRCGLIAVLIIHAIIDIINFSYLLFF